MNLNGTPGIKEGGTRQETKDKLRNAWKRQIESEERLSFWRRMVGMNIGVREVENISEDFKEKFRSEKMKGGKSDRQIVGMMMKMKYRDERGHQRELKGEKMNLKRQLETECNSRKSLRNLLSLLNKEAKSWRKLERRKYIQKLNHLKTIKEKEEIEKLENCPEEIQKYASLSIFSKEKYEKLKKEKIEISAIGEVDLDDDEKSLLKLPPKFAVRRRLDSLDMECDLEMGHAKTRYQIHKENKVREIENRELLENSEQCEKKRKILDKEEIGLHST